MESLFKLGKLGGTTTDLDEIISIDRGDSRDDLTSGGTIGLSEKEFAMNILGSDMQSQSNYGMESFTTKNNVNVAEKMSPRRRASLRK